MLQKVWFKSPPFCLCHAHTVRLLLLLMVMVVMKTNSFTHPDRHVYTYCNQAFIDKLVPDGLTVKLIQINTR